MNKGKSITNKVENYSMVWGYGDDEKNLGIQIFNLAEKYQTIENLPDSFTKTNTCLSSRIF